MPSSSSRPLIERARPLLGTRVTVRVRGLPADRAHRAIDAAFREVALVQCHMSFHDPASDVSRLNGAALRRYVTVAPQTLDVLREARALAEASRGCFDITVAAELVRWGLLPALPARDLPEPHGSWRDIELGPDGRVRFHRPLCIDLGGIAKGYAVDRAVDRLRNMGASQGCVDAGGDLRVFGPATEPVWLRSDARGERFLAMLEIGDASVASSSGRLAQRRRHGPHVHGVRRQPVGSRHFVSVVAKQCMIADALTKVVLAQGRRAEPLVRRYGAIAHLHGPTQRWDVFGAQA
jgi:thiamine biosynthesis lipoprotein